MKKLLVFFCFIVGFRVMAQIPNMPDSINYQAVLRDASGAVMPAGTAGTLNFRIFSDLISANADYEENHSFTVSAVGIVNLYIGGGSKVGTNTFANVNWPSGTASYEVRLNGTLITPRQAFAAVPYALYAKSSGSGSLPPGLVNQTMYYDASAGWKGTNNLANDGVRVGLGVAPSSRIKLQVASTDPNDSTLIHAAKLNAGIGDAAFRGTMIGNTNTTAINPYAPIFGADIRASNNGNGYAIGLGSSASASNGGTGIGLSATARGPSTSTLVGLFASVDTLANPSAYAAVFEKGKVMIGGDVYFPNAVSSSGYVYKIDGQKKGYWGLPSAGNSSITINQGGIVNVTPSGIPSTIFSISAVAPVFGTSGIGTIVPGAYPNYNLNIPTPSLSFVPLSGLLTFQQPPFVTSLNISPQIGLLGNILTVGTSTLAIPALNFWSKPTTTAVTLFSNSDFVGIGISNPSAKLEVIGSTKFSDVNTNVGFVSVIENNVSSGIDGGALKLSNTGVRSIGNSALLVENFTTKTTGSNSTKKGLEIQSTLPWTGPGLVNIGLLSNVSGASLGFNYSAIFTGGQVGINNNAPKSTLGVFGSLAVKKVSVVNSYNMLPDDYIVESIAPGAITIQLPLTTLVDEGTMIVIRSRTNFFIAIGAQGADQIQRLGTAATGSSTTIPALEVLRLYKSGGIWVEM